MCAGSHDQHVRCRPTPIVTALESETLTRDGCIGFSWECPRCGEENSGSGYPEDTAGCFRQCNRCRNTVKVTGI